MEDKYLYLPFRALGDFVITTAIIKNYAIDKIPVILPNYLKELFFELNADQYFDVIDYINFPIYPKLFELHKIKTLKHLMGFIGDYKIVSALNKKNNYVVDANCKRLFLTGLKFYHPVLEGNVYDTRFALLSKIYDFKAYVQNTDDCNLNIRKVVLFPGSRMSAKKINFAIAIEIRNYFLAQKIQIDISYHISEKPVGNSNEQLIIFENFNQLKNIVNDYDLIISADSLPLHFAYYLNKPHYCLYNNVPNLKWLTPSGLKQQFFSVITSSQKTYGQDVFYKVNNKGYIFEQALITQ